MEIFGSEEWFEIVEILAQDKGISIIIGATDTGKSTLAKFLISNLCQRGIKVGFIDSDIGQSFLGPPTTIGFLSFSNPPNWDFSFEPDIFFVGSTSPENYFNKHLKGVKWMLDKAINYGCEVILVDTTGYIFGEAGKELKRKKIELVSPKYILALQRSREVEDILCLYKNSNQFKIIRLRPSGFIKVRSMEERKRYRQRRFQEYFKKSFIQKIVLNKVFLEGIIYSSKGFTIPIHWALHTEGLVIGLKDGNKNTIALGIIRNYNIEKNILEVLTPLRDIEMIRGIEFGSIILNSSFEDERL